VRGVCKLYHQAEALHAQGVHEITQLLGITRVRLGHFLKAHEDVINHVSLHMCAALGAEVWDEEDAKIGILCWAVIRTDIKANSAVRYQVLKRLDSLFPGQIPPELLHPERNFEVIAGEPRDPS
jgi:hypothetical protein